jgi:hypothetical protein
VLAHEGQHVFHGVDLVEVLVGGLRSAHRNSILERLDPSCN